MIIGKGRDEEIDEMLLFSWANRWFNKKKRNSSKRNIKMDENLNQNKNGANKDETLHSVSTMTSVIDNVTNGI